jgi:hypothetical protein
MPVILLTGVGGMMQDAKEQPEGVNAVLGKPPSLTELRQAIRNCMAIFTSVFAGNVDIIIFASGLRV